MSKYSKVLQKGAGGDVDLIDQKIAAYKLDQKGNFRFYLRMFF